MEEEETPVEDALDAPVAVVVDATEVVMGVVVKDATTAVLARLDLVVRVTLPPRLLLRATCC